MGMGEESGAILGFVFMGIFILCAVIVLRRESMKKKNLRAAGYEVIAIDRYLYEKDGDFYLIPKYTLKYSMPIEVTGLSEIRQNSRLIGLEIRYLTNGETRLMRIRGMAQYLLNIQDKLGFN